MKRIGMTLAAAVVGGVLWTSGDAAACEGHSTKADAPPVAVEPSPQQQATSGETAPAKTDKAGELHAAKCQCGSAADCTCKKGTCECPKCKKPRHDVVAPLEAEGRASEVQKARLDASAGLFI
jgi:hypothetical protein